MFLSQVVSPLAIKWQLDVIQVSRMATTQLWLKKKVGTAKENGTSLRIR